MNAAIAVGSRIAHNAVDDSEEATDPRTPSGLLVADFDGDRHLQAMLIWSDGKVLRSSNVALAENPAPDWFSALLAARPRCCTWTCRRIRRLRHAWCCRPTPRNEVAEVWGDIGLTLSVLTIFCALVLASSTGRSATAIRPLTVLTMAFAASASGDYRERLDREGPLELFRLSQGFNQMVERLGRAEAQNKRLEEQLTDRAGRGARRPRPRPARRDRPAAVRCRRRRRRDRQLVATAITSGFPSASASSATPSARCSGTFATSLVGCARPCCSTWVSRTLSTIWSLLARAPAEPEFPRRGARGGLRGADRRRRLPHRAGESQQCRSPRRPEHDRDHGESADADGRSPSASWTTAAASSTGPRQRRAPTELSACRSASTHWAATSSRDPQGRPGVVVIRAFPRRGNGAHAPL